MALAECGIISRDISGDDSVPTRPVTDNDRDDIIDLVTGGLADLVTGSPGLFQDRPAFIAGDGPDQPFANTVRALTQYNCRVWASSDKTNFSTRVNTGNAGLCGPYLESIGENPEDGSIAPPYTGGQCSTTYLVYGTLAGNDQSIGGLTPRQMDGPISLISTQDVAVPGQPFGDSVNTLFTFSTASGDETVGVNWRSSFPFPRSFRIERVDSEPDDCGSVPATDIEPPSTVTPVTPIPPRITVNLPGLGPVNVTVDLDDDGDPTFCVDETGTCFSIDIGGPDAVPGGGGGPAPGDQGTGGTPSDTGSGGEAEGEAPPGEVLVGLLFDLLAAPAIANTYAPGVYRGAAYIYMGGSEGLDQDYAGSMLSDGQFVFAEKDNLTKWRVAANLGYSWRVTPFYREAETV